MRAVIATLFLATAAVTSPADLLQRAEIPAGFELANDEFRSQSFDDFLIDSRSYTGHVESGSSDASAMNAGSDIYVSGDDDTLLREVTVWSGLGAAEGYVQNVTNYAKERGLTQVDAPFGSAVAYEGDDPDSESWLHLIVWADGPTGAAVSQYHTGDAPWPDGARQAAVALHELMAPGSGSTPSDATGSTTANSTTGNSTAGSSTTGSSGGGIPVVKVLFWLAVAIGAIWLFVKVRKKIAAIKAKARKPRSADDIIDETRRKRRADRPREPVQERNADDVIAEARRRARTEVDQESDKWQVPDDY